MTSWRSTCQTCEQNFILKSHTKKAKTLLFPFFPVIIHYLARVAHVPFIYSQSWTPVPSHIYPKPMEKFGLCEKNKEKIKDHKNNLSSDDVQTPPQQHLILAKKPMPKLCDNPRHLTWKHSAILLNTETQPKKLTSLFPEQGTAQTQTKSPMILLLSKGMLEKVSNLQN